MQGEFTAAQKLLLGTVGGLLVLVALYFGWLKWYTAPGRVFNDMLVNNLTTQSVTKNELSGTSGNVSLERVNLQLAGTNAARWLVTVQQKSGTVSTESIGKKGVGYVRYTQIHSTQQKQDYSHELNIWAKSASGDGSSLADLFSQSLLDMGSAPVPPIGDLQPDNRQEVLSYIKNEGVFTPNYAKLKTATVNGRKVYVYPVAVKLAPYVRMMQAFSHYYGLKVLDTVSASDYETSAPATLTISVDKLSHEMLRVNFASTGFNETYSDYGVRRTVNPPTHTVTVKQLQAKLQKVQ